ncbi:MAG: gliding motility-associated C-terminal domain-containing protein [Sphingobacteriales bacterium]|nr:MAG: gliding motility-associated C-terminal domain-containing protein [Sphingobacteriales bacterium]
MYTSGGLYQTSVYATADNGCNSYTLSDSIRVYQTMANAGQDTILATGQAYTLRGSGGEIYRWSPATGLSDPNIPNPVFTPERNASFTLTTTTSFGCATTDLVQFKVFDGPEIYVPNAFTPNGDGKNDRFRPVAVGISEIRYFEVYNRYGQLIFTATDTYQGWDGNSKGRKEPSGTYVWRVTGIDFTGKQHIKKGTITLIR